MSNSVDWSKAPEGAELYNNDEGNFYKIDSDKVYYFDEENETWERSIFSVAGIVARKATVKRPEKQEKSIDASVSIANLLNAQVSIANARKSSEFSEHNAELADQADAILQAIIDNLKAERIPVEASFHLSNAQNELNACKSLLAGDKQLADAVFCLSEKLSGIRKGEL